ncbi:hypothetical protein VPH35_071275 [Triticum aestivum]
MTFYEKKENHSFLAVYVCIDKQVGYCQGGLLPPICIEYFFITSTRSLLLMYLTSTSSPHDFSKLGSCFVFLFGLKIIFLFLLSLWSRILFVTIRGSSCQAPRRCCFHVMVLFGIGYKNSHEDRELAATASPTPS